MSWANRVYGMNWARELCGEIEKIGKLNAPIEGRELNVLLRDPRHTRIHPFVARQPGSSVVKPPHPGRIGWTLALMFRRYADRIDDDQWLLRPDGYEVRQKLDVRVTATGHLGELNTYTFARGTAMPGVPNDKRLEEDDRQCAIDPDDVAYEVAEMAGNGAAMLDCAERLMQRHPCSKTAHVLAGNAHITLKQWDAAAQALTRALKLAPNDGMVWTQIGYVFYRKGATSEALASLEKGAVLQQVNPKAWEMLGKVLREVGLEERANQALRNAAIFAAVQR